MVWHFMMINTQEFFKKSIPLYMQWTKKHALQNKSFFHFLKKFFSKIDLIFHKFLAFDIRKVSNMKYTDVDHGMVQKKSQLNLDQWKNQRKMAFLCIICHKVCFV